MYDLLMAFFTRNKALTHYGVYVIMRSHIAVKHRRSPVEIRTDDLMQLSPAAIKLVNGFQRLE